MAVRYRYVFKTGIMEDKTIPAKLIYRKIKGKLSAVEEERFDAWLKEGWEHREYYERMQRIYQEENMQEVAVGKIQDAWEMFEKRVQGRWRVERKRRWMWGMSVAASVVIVLCLIMYYQVNTRKDMNIAVQNIVPGQYNAILDMADGSTYHLGEQQGSLQEKTGRLIKIDSTLVSYLPVSNKQEIPQEIVYNKLSVPRGGEYRIELEDGTKVWMNSESCLRYPIAFFNDMREVYLEGEAYFEVSKTGQPFIVQTKGMKIEVLGTSFNISAYANEEYQTTLVSGSVKVQTENGSNRVLKPSEQACITPGSNQINVRNVDTAFYTSWIHGKINFKDQRLDDIMKTLARWYDMDVVYENEATKELRFGCYVNRYNEITPLVKLLEQTGRVTVTVEGKTIKIFTNH